MPHACGRDADGTRVQHVLLSAMNPRYNPVQKSDKGLSGALETRGELLYEHDGGTIQAHRRGHRAEDPVLMAFFAQRQVLSERLMRYYAAAICGLVAVFVVFHWTHWALTRSLLIRKVPGFKSAGHAMVTVVYVAINASIAFTNVDFSSMRIRYEVFYVTHITCWVLAIVALGIHRPEIAHKTLVVVLTAASMWFVDRVIRACRILYYSTNNEAKLYPLPDESTKVVFKKAPVRTRPGEHCFIWIPAVRKFETHPFTVHGGSPVEFTVKARNGFTRALHKYAAAHPGEAVTASLDGPYGTFPDPMDFDKTVLIAGGGGASFTFGLAVNVLGRMDEDSPKHIIFIWSVRKHKNLFWFREQLELLRTHVRSPRAEHASLAEKESLKAVDAVAHTFCGHPVKIGRPDAASVIRDAVKTTPRNKRVLVAACGPDGLMRVVRDTTAKLIVAHGPAVELHCEEFGW
ncbi:hypothetical protein VTH06DRAFT_7305 [Thermothelomyces fergusii]